MHLLASLTRLILGRRKPHTSGTLSVPGVSQPTPIRRDAYGIPYITAQSDRDALYALGFCQGQDRSFQIENLLRITRGNLAEIIGPQGLVVDRLSARVGFRRVAEMQYQHIEPDDQERLAAFADGINAGARVGCPRPAHEFALLRTRPSTFQPQDVLSILNFVAFSLSTWPNKINRFAILHKFGPETVRILDRVYPEWIPATRPVNVPSGPNINHIEEDLDQVLEFYGLEGASNNWAVDAAKTETGRPLLANDPHLGPAIPSPWYLTQMASPEWTVAGACLAGTPFITTGHNSVAAWGVTAGGTDNVDLYLEQLEDDGSRVRDGEGTVPCQVIHKDIKIKGEEPFQDEILITPRGPIISDVLPGPDHPFSMKAAWMTPRPFPGLFDIFKVRDFASFRQAWANWYIASLNLVYADTANNIGWQLIGDVPERRKPRGTVPLPGWDHRYKWEKDRVPFEHMPYEHNPGAHFVATANNKPTAGDDPYLGFDYIDGYRLARINALLERGDSWTLEKMQEMQMDQASLPWDEIKEAVLNAPAARKKSRRAVELLSNWDGVVSATSPAAAVYEFFLTEMLREVVEAKAPGAADWVLGKQIHPLINSSLGEHSVSFLTRLLNQQPPDWFQCSWGEAIDTALTGAIRRLEEEGGPQAGDWSWGTIRPLTLMHALGSHWLFGSLFNRGPFAWGGDSETISQARRSLTEPTENPGGIANLRMVLDVGNWDNNLFVLAGGQSGNPFSPHYDDQLPLWKKGEGLTMAWSEAAIAESTETVLTLEPNEG